MGKTGRRFTSNEYSAPDLLQVGLDHLSAAAVLIKGHPSFFDSAGYLCHMGLELMLKAWLLHSSGSFNGTHPLRDHIDALHKAGQILSLTERQCQIVDYVSRFAELRYPSPVEIGSEDMELVGDIAEAIWQQMPDELVAAFEAIPAHKKGTRIVMRRRKDIPRNLELETGITAK